MKILSVDSSANAASVAVTEDEKLICECVVNNKKTHSQTLLPMIDKALKDSECSLSDIDLIAVTNGPGSFTGLRIGVATVKGLCHGAKKPVVGISTLECMAYNLPYCEHIICPIMDARREQVYNGVYEWSGEELVQIKEPRAMALEELLAEFENIDKKVVFLGDGVPVYREIICKAMGDKALFAPEGAQIQRASSLAPIARKRFEKGEATSSYELLPVYLRKSQAEREAEEREKQQAQN